MTPTDLVDLIRKRHNAVGDNFWSDDEILQHVYDACLQMARDSFCIERVYTTTTTDGTQEYSYPSNTIAIKRVTYNGTKLQPISFREDDMITGFNADTTSTGTPQYYFIFNDTVYLRPIPDDSTAELKIYSFNEPQEITTTSTLEIPSQFQIDTADYAISQMAAKEGNFNKAQYFMAQWEKKLMKIKQWGRKRLRTDSFAGVLDVETSVQTFLGNV